MIAHVELAQLPEDLQKVVLAKYRVALMNTERMLTYEEAAWIYGFKPCSIRHMVHKKRLRTVSRGRYRFITHAAMRAYLRQKRKAGAPRKALKSAQLSIN